jgi:Ring finger domain
MTSAQDSNFLLNSLTQNSTFGAEIGLNNNNTSHSTNTNNNTATAIAGVCILYIASGIIVLLFLIVIVSGAIRAHRNPERYGPRASIRGLPRQSRAKGLARAMLETLPIIKFGDLDLAKPSERAIALEDGISKVQQDVEVTGVAVLEDVVEQTNHGMAGGAEGSGKAGSEPSANAVTGEGTSEPVQKAHDGLECSICTEDFHFGEDVRVLPCNHKYHPACIDPWLLNVSGTCPLWYMHPTLSIQFTSAKQPSRHDLQPIPTATAEGNELPALIPPSEGLEGGIAPTGEGETAMNASHHHSLRISRLLDLTRLRTAPPEERIAALRQLHEQLLREGEAEGVAQPNRPAGLTSRLRDTFRIRTRTEPPAQE